MPFSEIRLNPDEEGIVEIIRNVCAVCPEKPTARICGGWVRDHLLGKSSKDIDVMLDTISGEAFAHRVAKYIGSKDPYIIRGNPEKSKHIETASANIPLPSGGTQKVDFAQARQDVYTDASRIPTTSLATPEDDASRRDLTINALFYNLNTQQVEDYTGQGLTDLENKNLRAPGEPFTRFMEDPLRVLRVARFAARYGWQIDPVTFQAMKDPRVLDILQHKTSQERIGAELTGLLKEKYAVHGIEILQACGIPQRILQNSIKSSPYENQLASWDMDQKNPHHTLNLWNHTLGVLKAMSDRFPEPDIKRVIMMLSALLHDTGKMFPGAQQQKSPTHTSYHGHEDHSQQISRLFLKHLRLDNMVTDYVGNVVRHHMDPYQMLQSQNPKTLRRFVRELAQLGIEWVDLIHMVSSDVSAKGLSNQALQTEIAEIDNLRQRIQQAIAETNQSPNAIKTILNGNEIMQAFNRTDSGQWIRKVMDYLMDLQDGNPNLSKPEAIKMVKEQFPELIKPFVQAAKHSQVLLDARDKQITELISSSPQQAMNIATKLWKSQPDDERGLILCLKTALTAKHSTNTNLMTEELLHAAMQLAANRFFNPEFSYLFLSCKRLMGKKLDKKDQQMLQRAFIMDRRITHTGIESNHLLRFEHANS